jgi:hypothetical protein
MDLVRARHTSRYRSGPCARILRPNWSDRLNYQMEGIPGSRSRLMPFGADMPDAIKAITVAVRAIKVERAAGSGKTPPRGLSIFFFEAGAMN